MKFMHRCFSFHSVQLRETARNFFEKELAPHASDIDRDNDFPKFRVREVAKLATLVAEGGGVKGRDSRSLPSPVAMHGLVTMLGTPMAIDRTATPSQNFNQLLMTIALSH